MSEKEVHNNDPANTDDEDESDDEDYVPSENEVSEEEKSGDEEDFIPSDDENKAGNRQRKKGNKKTKKAESNPRLARGTSSTPDEGTLELKKQIEQEQVANKEQKEKSKADALWASFMADVTPPPKRTQNTTEPSSSTAKPPVRQSSSSTNGTNKPVGTVKVTKVFDFAGETVRMEKEVKADSKEAKESTEGVASASSSTPGTKRPGGLGAVLGFINKKQKISTLDKSKLDWEKYKKDSGLEDELKSHTNSKASYLDKKEFLERSDQRQFEKERDARLASSSRR